MDPVEGGTLNNYVYVLDPINQYDTNGQFLWFAIPIIAIVVTTIVSNALAIIRSVPIVIKFWENLRTDSEVSNAIKVFETQNP